MEKKKIKAVIFDLGGVVMHGGYLDFVRHYCKEALTKEGQKKILALEREVNLGNISENKFYREIEKEFHVKLLPAQIHSIITKKMQTNKSLVKFLPKLSKTKTALYTNSIGHMALDVLKMRKVPISKIFDKVFISSKLHLAKPDPRAYEYALKKMKVKPEEAIMVDDRVENILPAKKIGMNGIVFKNTTQFKKELKKYQLAD